MAYTTATNVRTVSDLTVTEITDTNLSSLIEIATAQLNADINIEIIRERIEYIDATRTNDIDGSNTYFYIKNWKEYYLGDRDNDGTVDTGDVIVYQVDNNNTETTLTVSAIDGLNGKITLSSAPSSGVKLYITYVISPVDESVPNILITHAINYLAAAYAFTRIDAKKIAQFSIGKIRVTRQSQAFDIFYRKYQEVLNRIRKYPLKKSEGESIV